MTAAGPAAAVPAPSGGEPRRRLPVLSAVATGATTLSAFHRALNTIRVGHYNLVRLSSVVPAGVVVEPAEGLQDMEGAWGDRLYCVYAEQRTSTPGEEVWAAVGWVQRPDGRGYLVEHEGGSEGYVRDALHKSLDDMVDECGGDYGDAGAVVVGGHCEGRPICALVLVPFGTVPWNRGSARATGLASERSQVGAC